MEALSETKHRGEYIIMNVLGDKAIVRRLAEMGMISGKKVTVISLSTDSSGMMIYFQGQRLAISLDIAERIVVRDVKEAAGDKLRSLSDLHVGKSGIIRKMVGDRALRRRLLDMGLTNKTVVKVNQIAPLGDPIELMVRGYKLSLRKRDASCVLIEEV
ncbi:FeoA family protein [Lentilactobacillus farraginis]|uniref:FeoA family protein n=2 Tax=Lentilactobacillus farraginis DSM 18382 = JCM 14108 TaxID=1423743 RepID=X0PKN3_9LACO|nr:FeoA family protein [Lentilactobacillus farraginis]GAF37241.1 FeoA family protein [Lentilactobacillus farraginis DSM 18382 = JCM 14108]